MTELETRAEDRKAMVKTQIRGRGVRDEAILRAFLEVPRERFVSPGYADLAYTDSPLPIGEGQTISQPYIVALMAEALMLRPQHRVLDVGTGSGYAAAILAKLAKEVYSVEWYDSLAEGARRVLQELGYTNVFVRQGDGSLGWPQKAPFDAIMVSASGPKVPRALLEQLTVGGRLVIPVGDLDNEQNLLRVTRTGPNDFDQEDLGPVRFVPLVGQEGWGTEPSWLN